MFSAKNKGLLSTKKCKDLHKNASRRPEKCMSSPKECMLWAKKKGKLSAKNATIVITMQDQKNASCQPKKGELLAKKCKSST